LFMLLSCWRGLKQAVVLLRAEFGKPAKVAAAEGKF
jgi:hypothetical protein